MNIELSTLDLLTDDHRKALSEVLTQKITEAIEQLDFKPLVKKSLQKGLDDLDWFEGVDWDPIDKAMSKKMMSVLVG